MLGIVMVVALSGLGDFEPSARLLADAAPSKGAESAQKAKLQKRLVEIEASLAQPDDGWGAGYATAAVAGFTLSAAILVGLVMVVAGILPTSDTDDTPRDPVLAGIGGGVMLLGGGAFAVGAWAVGAGTTHMNDAKNRRFALHKEKQAVQDELDALDVAAPLPPPSARFVPGVLLEQSTRSS